LQCGLKGRKRTVILSLDETIITETPPIRASWSPAGKQAEVPITGNHDRRVLYGVLNLKSGKSLLHSAKVWDQYQFQLVLYKIRHKWRGWHIVLFIDRGSPHKAANSQQLARKLGIQIRWLPVACPELNPVDHIWRHVKQDVLANEATPDLDVSVKRVRDYIMSLTPKQLLRKAGVLSEKFWLRNVL
jgi:transposase